ncbi:GGDEF domain-containing protein [Thalassotalea sediminis]|uniref:GGDEF domain-containing protein n=1 Tax=Thalassotalea sediminis TaxID=1759089 RepID=UPI002572EB27|nr:GGDEF domain-containing protein [Thalassotalea sediminis]
MTGNKAVDKELIVLKRKLDAAITARADVESDLTHQSVLLTEFIIKLSQIAKGVDVSLDNKLAKLRQLFNSKASISDIETLINDTSTLLYKYSTKADNEIRVLRDNFHSAGKSLQKINGLPDDLRRQLRTLLKDNEQSKDALSQYIPLLTQLVSLYQIALKKGNIAESTNGLLSKTHHVTNPAGRETSNKGIIKKFNDFLSKINISRKYQEQIQRIRAQLSDNMPNDKLFDSFLATFDVISQDLIQERNTAKVFLSTLSDTLATVQSAVTDTIESHEEKHEKLNLLNERMQKQLNDMAHEIESANSLVDIKVEINEKLHTIASTLEKKKSYEAIQQKQFTEQLESMSEKVNKLEIQSRAFEKQIKEQQAKSLEDALTKLYNRAAFDEHFHKEIARCQHNKRPLAIVVADLDNFKNINDTYGHTAGDKTLQVIANTLKKHLEKHAFVARYGGEEFVFVFNDIEKDNLIHTLNLLRKTIAKLPFKFRNDKVSMTMSIGVTHIREGDNVHIAFERADKALYEAKEKGKNQVIYID